MNSIKKRQQPFTSVSNEFLRDNRISFKAKGLFCYMFSMADGWNFTIRSIASQQKDGQDSIQSALDELKEYHYVTYEKHSDGTGTYHLNDEPKTEKPNQENPKLGNSTRIKKEQLPKNKNNIDVTLINEFSLVYGEPNEKALEAIVRFLKYRRSIKKNIKTAKAIKMFMDNLKDCLAAKYSMEEVFELMESKEWSSISLDWVQKSIPKEKEWSAS